MPARPNATRQLNESFARVGDPNDAKEEKQEQRQRDRHADESDLLADHREDEVGVLLGQKRETLLRS